MNIDLVWEEAWTYSFIFTIIVIIPIAMTTTFFVELSFRFVFFVGIMSILIFQFMIYHIITKRKLRESVSKRKED
jgi:hypothetical protein